MSNPLWDKLKRQADNQKYINEAKKCVNEALKSMNSGILNSIGSGWNYKTYGLPSGQMNFEYDWLQGTTPKLPEIKCSCGISITLGALQDNWEFHSSYCDCFKEQRIK